MYTRKSCSRCSRGAVGLYSGTTAATTTDAVPDTTGMDVDPGAWIAGVWGSYVNLYPSILGLEHEAATVAATNPVGTPAHDIAKKVLDGAVFLAKVHTATVNKVEEYSGYLGLGSVTVALSLVFAGLAAIILWSFVRYDSLRNVLAGVNAGTITPEQGQSLLDAGTRPDMSIIGVANTGLVVAGLVALALLLYRVLPRGRPQSNPDLVALRSNPDAVWSHRVMAVEYVHDDNGEPYRHDFGRGVEMEGLEDGSVRLFNPRRNIWRDFDVEE